MKIWNITFWTIFNMKMIRIWNLKINIKIKLIIKMRLFNSIYSLESLLIERYKRFKKRELWKFIIWLRVNKEFWKRSPKMLKNLKKVVKSWRENWDKKLVKNTKNLKRVKFLKKIIDIWFWVKNLKFKKKVKKYQEIWVMFQLKKIIQLREN